MRCPNMIVKIAEIGIAPFDTSKDNYQSLKNYVKEYANRIIGSTAHAAGGAAIGAGFGAGFGGLIGGRGGAGLGALVGGYAGAIPGSIVGDVTSLRKTERDSGVKPTGVGQYLGRGLMSGIIPFGDYFASRMMQSHPKEKK